MGCWNETCLISNLPVTHGDEVAMTVITKNEDGEWYKPNSLFYISPIMFYGEYNDYGSGEECYGLGLDFTKDEYHNYKTTLDKDLPPDELVEKIAREDLKFHNVKSFKASLMGYEDSDRCGRLGFIRKDVLDRIMEDYTWEQTFYQKTEDGSYIYETINYQYFLDCIPNTIKTCKAFYKKQAELYASMPSLAMSMPLPDSDMEDTDMLLKWLFAHDKESSNHPFHKSITNKVKELAEANKDEELTEFLAEFSKYSILYKFMMESRKVFTPQPNTSQECDTDAQQYFAKMVIDIALKHDSKYDDDSEWDPVRKVLIQQHELEF